MRGSNWLLNIPVTQMKTRCTAVAVRVFILPMMWEGV
ncbi:hypothetical protein A2U01_0085146, partial [Trifolium medium]|nr:hypothetical protein [Trifolium medium]